MPLDLKDGDFHFKSEPMIFKGSIGKKEKSHNNFQKIKEIPSKESLSSDLISTSFQAFTLIIA